jgi:hypothetical protein
VLQYHSGDDYATSKTEAKVDEYKVEGFPSMFFNGGNLVKGGGEGSYNKYSTIVSQELKKTCPASMAGGMTFSGNAISLKAAATNISNSSITDAKMIAVVYEDLGTDEHHYVVRDIRTLSKIATLAPGATQQFTLSSSLSGSLSKMRAVFILQSSSGQVLQSVLGSAQ